MRVHAVSPLRFTLPPSGILAAESVHEPRFRMDFEHHDFYELYYIYKGSVAYYGSETGDPLVLEAGMFHAISPGERHRIEDRSPATLLLFCMSGAFMKAGGRLELWRQIVAASPLRPDAIACRLFEQGMRRLLAEQDTPRIGSTLVIEAEANNLLVRLARSAGRTPAREARDRVRHVVDLMRVTFFEAWNLDDAARRAHLSRRRFSTLFREMTGLSFVEKLNELRVRHAAHLMRDGRQSICGAAFSSGFNDLSHFYQLFRRHYGMAPGRWLARGAVDGADGAKTVDESGMLPDHRTQDEALSPTARSGGRSGRSGRKRRSSHADGRGA